MKLLIILTGVLLLCACNPKSPFTTYALVTKYGIMAGNLKSLEDCQAIINKFKIEGVCIED